MFTSTCLYAHFQFALKYLTGNTKKKKKMYKKNLNYNPTVELSPPAAYLDRVLAQPNSCILLADRGKQANLAG